VKVFVQICSKIFDPPEPIFEIGSLQVSGQEGYADLRPLFQGKTYVGCDMRPGLGVDRIENVENLTIQDETVGTILIIDTLEHVENPHKALDEIYRVLKKDGIIIMTSVMNFPIHDYPGDFWRFTPEAFNLLLKDFPVRIIGSQGHPLNPHTVFGIGFKSNADDPVICKFEEFYRCFLEELYKGATLKIKSKILKQLFSLPIIKIFSYAFYFSNNYFLKSEELSFKYIKKTEMKQITQNIRTIIK